MSGMANFDIFKKLIFEIQVLLSEATVGWASKKWYDKSTDKVYN